MAHAWSDEDLDKARDLATELGRCTGAHKWLALCGYVLNLTRDLKEIRQERDEIRDRLESILQGAIPHA